MNNHPRSFTITHDPLSSYPSFPQPYVRKYSMGFNEVYAINILIFFIIFLGTTIAICKKVSGVVFYNATQNYE